MRRSFMENTRALTAPCGLDCFNCELHKNNVTDEMREMVSPMLGIPPAEVQCDGCRTQKGERLGLPLCETYQCATEKGVEFCVECDEFPCSMLQPARDGADRYPHNLKMFNLCRIKAVGVDKWAEEAVDIRKKYFLGKFIVGTGPVRE
jgi:hypothetical protein